MNLVGVTRGLATEDACLACLEKLRWPNGLGCLRCGGVRVSALEIKKSKRGKARRIYQCLEQSCHLQFTATTGTIFHDTRLPLRKWFLAIALICESKKGMSANRLSRALGVQYRTAWHLCHRIRKAMEEGDLPKLTGVVEVDETYVGDKPRNMHADTRRKRITGIGWVDEGLLLGIMQRGGKVAACTVPTVKKAVLVGRIKDRVSTEVEMIVRDALKS